jgi:hypothetical protein
MFEKEAKGYTHTKHCEKCSTGHCEKKCILVKDDYEAFKDGATFGYNKANEWHYVKEGCKYPENGESVLVTVLNDDNEKIVTMALFEVENNKRFWDIESRLCSVHSGSEEVCSKIIAWARVLPAGGEK